MLKEIKIFKEGNICMLLSLESKRKDKSLVLLMQLLKYKRNSCGELIKYKARLCINGTKQVEGTDY